jgi:hypothetical protein
VAVEQFTIACILRVPRLAAGGEETALSIRDALLGIKQRFDQSGSRPCERPSSIVQPVVYQYLRPSGAKAACPDLAPDQPGVGDDQARQVTVPALDAANVTKSAKDIA